MENKKDQVQSRIKRLNRIKKEIMRQVIDISLITGRRSKD